MSRSSTALAATAMAVAAAGGGLLIAAASAVPAGASATGTPAAPQPGHTITIHAHPRAHAASGIGPHLQSLPCGSDICTPGSGGPTITCSITANTPAVVGGSPKAVIANAETNCDAPVDEITMSEDLAIPSGQVLVNQDNPPNATRATTGITTSCVAGQYVNAAAAFIDFPPGYVVISGSNPVHQSVSISVAASSCSSGGGGGGGGAAHAPALATHPAGRHPDLVVCS